jgi:hypothetical protein
LIFALRQSRASDQASISDRNMQQPRLAALGMLTALDLRDEDQSTTTSIQRQIRPLLAKSRPP